MGSCLTWEEGDTAQQLDAAGPTELRWTGLGWARPRVRRGSHPPEVKTFPPSINSLPLGKTSCLPCAPSPSRPLPLRCTHNHHLPAPRRPCSLALALSPTWLAICQPRLFLPFSLLPSCSGEVSNLPLLLPNRHQPCARRNIYKSSSMSEVASRPTASRGRGSGRGARGGFAGRGARRINGDKSDHKPADDGMGAFDDEGDFAELRKQYGDKTSVIREMFPDWSEADVLFALQETNGDQNEAVARIAEGTTASPPSPTLPALRLLALASRWTSCSSRSRSADSQPSTGTISQWGEVSKPKKTTRVKAAKDPNHAPAALEPSTPNTRNTRGGRAVSDGGRGRSRGADRGGRGGRGRPVNTSTNGTRNKENQQLSVPTEESSAWDNEKPKMDNTDPKPVAAEKPIAQDAPRSATPQAKTWASMLRQSTAPKPATLPKEPPVPKPAETAEMQPSAEPVPPEPEAAELADETTPIVQNAVPATVPAIAEPQTVSASARAELTETNLEQVADASNPPATDTAASTAADSWDPRQSPVSATATPLSAAQHQHQAQRTTTSGFAASALKATAERSARAPSHQRRVLDQEEAVRMPGNREVDRAAVQFGAFNLQGGDEDIDGEREEPETRAQPPADSPVAHPRASLPPVSQPVAVPESYPQKPAATLPAGASGVGMVKSGDSTRARFANVATAATAATAPAAHPQGMSYLSPAALIYRQDVDWMTSSERSAI